jgi:hypothetical protein
MGHVPPRAGDAGNTPEFFDSRTKKTGKTVVSFLQNRLTTKKQIY